MWLTWRNNIISYLYYIQTIQIYYDTYQSTKSFCFNFEAFSPAGFIEVAITSQPACSIAIRYFQRLAANRCAFKSGTCYKTVRHAMHECIRAHQVWSASCAFQHLDRYVTSVRLKIMAVCL